MGQRYKYSWSKTHLADAQAVGEVYQRCGPDEVVLEAAADLASPLHGLLEWDDKTAGHQHRLMQVRQIRASLRVEIVDTKGTVQYVQAFVMTADRTGGYVPTLEADEDDLTANESRCWQQMQAFRARWKGLQFARLVVSAIDSTTKTAARRAPKKRARKRA